MKIEEYCFEYCDIDTTILCGVCCVRRVLNDMNNEIEKLREINLLVCAERNEMSERANGYNRLQFKNTEYFEWIEHSLKPEIALLKAENADLRKWKDKYQRLKEVVMFCAYTEFSDDDDDGGTL